ncbi:MAG: riboflavin synthase, partial [Gammaproteobacteria bacterium]|nr:riboflavin synthase [Gammaproteobacteria bacterium]
TFSADVSAETLRHTTLGDLAIAAPVNLEKAITANTRLGGHFVSGHVDGVASIIERREEARSVFFRVAVPAPLAKYIAKKGSVCVNGVSLTVNDVTDNEFDLNIVPHTLDVTTMSDFQQGTKVNIEVDIIARYLERLLLGENAIEKDDVPITMEMLAKSGFSAK